MIWISETHWNFVSAGNRETYHGKFLTDWYGMYKKRAATSIRKHGNSIGLATYENIRTMIWNGVTPGCEQSD